MSSSKLFSPTKYQVQIAELNNMFKVTSTALMDGVISTILPVVDYILNSICEGLLHGRME